MIQNASRWRRFLVLTSAVCARRRARALLLCDVRLDRALGGQRRDREVAARLGCSAWFVGQLRRRACERGVLEAVKHQEQENRKARKLDGRAEATLVALTCSAAPEGHSRWSLRVLRERLIELEVVEQIGLETIRTTLKKTRSSRG